MSLRIDYENDSLRVTIGLSEATEAQQEVGRMIGSWRPGNATIYSKTKHE